PARLRVSLDVHAVADAVARARVIDPELARHRLKHPVVVRALDVELDDAVVDVLERAIEPHATDVELHGLHAGHRAGGVLQRGRAGALRPTSSRLVNARTPSWCTASAIASSNAVATIPPCPTPGGPW